MLVKPSWIVYYIHQLTPEQMGEMIRKFWAVGCQHVYAVGYANREGVDTILTLVNVGFKVTFVIQSVEKTGLKELERLKGKVEVVITGEEGYVTDAGKCGSVDSVSVKHVGYCDILHSMGFKTGYIGQKGDPKAERYLWKMLQYALDARCYDKFLFETYVLPECDNIENALKTVSEDLKRMLVMASEYAVEVSQIFWSANPVTDKAGKIFVPICPWEFIIGQIEIANQNNVEAIGFAFESHAKLPLSSGQRSFYGGPGDSPELFRKFARLYGSWWVRLPISSRR